METTVEKWNALTDQQRASFGDRFITHETNLSAWVKDFESLSVHKQKMILKNFPNIEVSTLNYTIGFGVR